MEYDVAIIGAGPAGIQAAIHASRKKVSVVVLGKLTASAMSGTHIENYFGIPGTSDGDSILKAGKEQAESFGCVFMEKNIISAHPDNGDFIIATEDDEEITAKSVILATGISRKKLNVPGEKELFGKGVSYCTVCDCNFYKGKTAVIVGNETEAAVSAELMTKYASKTYWVSDDMQASDTVYRKALDAGAEFISSKIREIKGGDRVSSVLLENGSEIETDGVFIELGAKSSVDIAMDLDVMPEMDDTVKVDRECKTEAPGVFACGDITGKPWQIAKAVGEGAIAGLSAAEYVKGRK